jgi:hypothetical protein
MADLKIIWTNRVLEKMKTLGLTEAHVLDAFNTGEVEKSKIGGFNAIKKYPGRELGVYYDRRTSGEYVIMSVWERKRR